MRPARHPRHGWRAGIDALLAALAAFVFALWLVSCIERVPDAGANAAAAAARQLEAQQRREKAACQVKQYEREHRAAAHERAQEQLQTRLTDFQHSLEQAEALAAAIDHAGKADAKASAADIAGKSTASPAITKQAELDQQLSYLEARKTSLLERLTPSHPRVAAITAEIERHRERQGRFPRPDAATAAEPSQKPGTDQRQTTELIAVLGTLNVQRQALQRTLAERDWSATDEGVAAERVTQARGDAQAPAIREQAPRSTPPPRWPGMLITVVCTVLAVLAARQRRAVASKQSTAPVETSSAELEATLGVPVVGVITATEPGESRQAAKEAKLSSSRRGPDARHGRYDAHGRRRRIGCSPCGARAERMQSAERGMARNYSPARQEVCDMYEAFFHLKQRPFTAAARTDRYYPAPGIDAARQTLARCIERAEGAGLLVGPSGSGKTLVLQLLAEQFRGRFALAFLANGHLSTRRELLQAIAFELGLPFRRMEEGELRLSLIDRLSDASDESQGLLLLLDEAHTFPTRLLEEVRLMTNLMRNGQPRVRLVLAGSPALEERFANPRLEAFSQRIASRAYLEPLDLTQTRRYVEAQLLAVGGEPARIFTTDALDQIYRATDGIPRLINQVCDHALMLAFAGGQRQLNAAGIEEAWADLQQLPSPWIEAAQADSKRERRENIIEFGGLDDAPPTVAGDHAPSAGIPKRAEVADDTLEPTLLLNEIDEHLTALDDDFAPVVALGPSRAAQHADPFGGGFEEEEVLIDRYASLEASGQRRRPVVASHEGRVLSLLLAPHVRTAESPPLSLIGSPQADEPAHAPTAVTAAGAAPDKLAAIPPTAVPPPAAAASVGANPASREAGLVGNCAYRGRIDDIDLIVVEDDPPVELPLTAVRKAPAARRLEYRQLFSKLRQG